MLRILGVIGVPGTGKTTLTRVWMKQYANDWKRVEPQKLVTCEWSHETRTYVLGKYDTGEVFAGTDKLSMAVMPEAKVFLNEIAIRNGGGDVNVYFEGDRLGAQSFFEFISELPDTELSILLLKADSRTLSIRYSERGSDQSEQFLRGRETKVASIAKNFNLIDYVTVRDHEVPEDTDNLVEWINEQFRR